MNEWDAKNLDFWLRYVCYNQLCVNWNFTVLDTHTLIWAVAGLVYFIILCSLPYRFYKARKEKVNQFERLYVSSLSGKYMNEWSVNDVYLRLYHVNDEELSHWAVQFKKHSVDGQQYIGLTDGELMELFGNHKFACYRLKLLRSAQFDLCNSIFKKHIKSRLDWTADA